MKRVYLDNAATTPIAKEVINVMHESMLENFGNPSSTHQNGRMAKASVEKARKNIARQLHVSASEIYFTCGGTEADNWILNNAVSNLNVKTIITTEIEHSAVLDTILHLQRKQGVKIIYLSLDKKGRICLKELQKMLATGTEKKLVSLMWVNNEIGNVLPIQEVAELCKKHQVLFHSDTVQAIGSYDVNLQELPIDFIVASAHKFHGPKGVGFAFVRKGIPIEPMLYGGGQERGARSSTENLHSILGMDKALQLSNTAIKHDSKVIAGVKEYLIQGLYTIFPDLCFNGDSESKELSSPKIVNVRFPFSDDMLIFNLDLLGISVSGGSACQSGAIKGSHVLSKILDQEQFKKSSLRISFSKYTTKDEIDQFLQALETRSTIR